MHIYTHSHTHTVSHLCNAANHAVIPSISTVNLVKLDGSFEIDMQMSRSNSNNNNSNKTALGIICCFQAIVPHFVISAIDSDYNNNKTTTIKTTTTASSSYQWSTTAGDC